MSIEWMDNFSQYGVDELNMLDGLWADRISGGAFGPNLVADPDGVSGGLVLNLVSGSMRRVLSTAKTTVGVAFRLWMDQLPISSNQRYQVLQFTDAVNAEQITLLIETTGVISAYRGAGTAAGTLLGSTAVPALVAGAWNHIEMKVLFSQTVGTVGIKVNEVSVLALTGQDTVATALVECSQIKFTGLCYNGDDDECYIKDVIVWNADGSVNNDFMGDLQVVTIVPTSDDTFAGWTSTGANGFSVIDETTPDDADYINAVTPPPAAVVFGLSNLDPDVTVVKGLMTIVRTLKTDAGAANLQIGLTSGASTDNGADRPITTAATYYGDISELDPNTASAWTRTTVDAAKLRVNRTT